MIFEHLDSVNRGVNSFGNGLGKTVVALLLIVVALAGRPEACLAVQRTQHVVAKNLTERQIKKEIQRLRKDRTIARVYRFTRIVDFAEALVERFPDSTYTTDARILELTALSGLATIDSTHVTEFLELTETIACHDADARLEAENAFYAIQAFVLGACVENMPKGKRLYGTRERYEAFIEDHPTSFRAPIIMASLVRNLLAGSNVDKATAWVNRLKASHPGQPATLRAEGELRRATAVGKPYRIQHVSPDDSKLDTLQFKGQVVVVHFWNSRIEGTAKTASQLLALHTELAPKGLTLIGVNLDYDSKQAEAFLTTSAMPWSHFFAPRGLNSEVVIANGVLALPSNFIIDRTGTLRGIGAGQGLRELVTRLLGESGDSTNGSPQGGTTQPKVKPKAKLNP